DKSQKKASKNQKHIGRNDRHKQIQNNKRERNKGSKNSQHNSENRGLVPSPKRGGNQEAQKDRVQKIASKNVSPQTDSEREHTSAGADDLDGKDKRGKQWNGAREMLDVGNTAVMPDSLPIEIYERKNRARQGDA